MNCSKVKGRNIFSKVRFDREKISIIVDCKLLPMVKEKVKPIGHQDDLAQHVNQLILFNDDVNSFDFVIDTLVDVCGHDPLQAEQCAWIAHYKGKCAIKEGSFAVLKPLHDEMGNRGLTVSIEK